MKNIYQPWGRFVLITVFSLFTFCMLFMIMNEKASPVCAGDAWAETNRLFVEPVMIFCVFAGCCHVKLYIYVFAVVTFDCTGVSPLLFVVNYVA